MVKLWEIAIRLCVPAISPTTCALAAADDGATEEADRLGWFSSEQAIKAKARMPPRKAFEIFRHISGPHRTGKWASVIASPHPMESYHIFHQTAKALAIRSDIGEAV